MSSSRPPSFDPAALQRFAELIGEKYIWRELEPFFTDAGASPPPRQQEDSKPRYANRVLRQLQQEPNGMQRVAHVIAVNDN